MKLTGLAAALLAAVVIAVPAIGSPDKPTPCGAGNVTTDATGDAFVGFAGNSSPVPADSNQDITNLFFRNDGKVVTANLSIADLHKKVPAGAVSMVYRLFWTYKEVQQFIDVEVAGDGTVTYTYGHFDTTPTGDGDTPGQFFEGKDGVISVRIPSAVGGVPGTKLNDVRWNSTTTNGVVLMQSDVVPDSGGVAYSGTPCDGVGGPTGPTGPTGLDQPRSVTLKASKPDKAKTASKKKKLGLSLAASETLSAVNVQLKKGAKLLGSAKLASLGTTATKVKIKLKKKIRKGSYTLALTGKNASGTAVSASAKLKLK